MKMTRFRITMTAAAVAMLATTAIAQPPGGGRGRGPQGPGGPGGPGGRGGPPPSPLIEALDADRDGVISAKEIENAVAALKSLDKNEDGKLSRDELAPRGFGRGFGAGRPGGPGAGGPGGPGGGNPEAMIAQLMKQYDKNEDGKITKEEAGDDRRANFLLGRADADEDGAVTKEELAKMISQFRGRGGRGGEGGRPGRPGRPGGEGGEGGEGGRPRRPPSDE